MEYDSIELAQECYDGYSQVNFGFDVYVKMVSNMTLDGKTLYINFNPGDETKEELIRKLEKANEVSEEYEKLHNKPSDYFNFYVY